MACVACICVAGTVDTARLETLSGTFGDRSESRTYEFKVFEKRKMATARILTCSGRAFQSVLGKRELVFRGKSLCFEESL